MAGSVLNKGAPMTAPSPAETTALTPGAAPPVGWDVLFGLAAVKLALHAAVGSGYGFHQDEFYYLACGRRPAWGYVDQPPVVPLLGRMAESLFGAGLTSGELRWFSALAGAVTVLLGGLMARELRGGRFAQGLAALAVFSMPLVLAAGELFETVVFDQLAWALACWLTLRTLRTGRGQGWLLVGLAAGVGLEVKFTMGLFGLGLAVALLATRTGRRHLRTPWPWLGGALALVLTLPNLLWQHARGWPTAEFIHNNNAWNREGWTLTDFLLLQALYTGPALGLVALGAWWAAGSHRGSPGARAGLWIAGTTAAALLLLRGKPYYLGPVYPVLAAAGSVAAAELIRRWSDARPEASWVRWLRPGVVLALVSGALLLGPVALPVVPLARLAGSRAMRLNPDLARHVGWPELVAQVEVVVRGLSAAEQSRTTILSVNYEEAAAIEHYAPALAARLPVVSPHNNYWLWGPGEREPQTVVVVGAWKREWQEELFGRVERVATIVTPGGVTNEWTGRGIFVCREPKKPLREAWPGLKNFN